MDPHEALFDLVFMFRIDGRSHDRQRAAELREALWQWIEKGGFAPDWDLVTEFMYLSLTEVLTVPNKNRPAWVWNNAWLAKDLYTYAVHQEGGTS